MIDTSPKPNTYFGQVLRNVAIVSYNSQKVVNTTSDGVIELKLRPGAKLVVTYLISNK